MILVIAYMALGYWAAGEIIYKNKIYVEYKLGAYFMQRLTYGAILGWILIPIALIKKFFN